MRLWPFRWRVEVTKPPRYTGIMSHDLPETYEHVKQQVNGALNPRESAINLGYQVGYKRGRTEAP